jgi:hypothetical protein
MRDDLKIVVILVVWHLAMLNALSLYTGLFAQTPYIAPKSVLLGRWHKFGVVALGLAAFICVVSSHGGWLRYGIWLAGALVLADAWLTYRAFVARKREWQKISRRL